jgi:hypothetical protein
MGSFVPEADIASAKVKAGVNTCEGKNAHRLTRVTVVIHNHEKIFFIQNKKPFNMVRRFNLRVNYI